MVEEEAHRERQPEGVMSGVEEKGPVFPGPGQARRGPRGRSRGPQTRPSRVRIKPGPEASKVLFGVIREH